MVCGLNYKTRNVIHLASGFICIFFAFNSQGFIEETVISHAATQGLVAKKAGYYSLAIIYAFSMAANLVIAPLVDLIGPRFSMAGGGLTYTTFLVGMLFLNTPYLYISSALLGIGSAFLWTAQGAYLTLNSTKETASRNSGLLWGMLQTSLLGGGCFLLAVFSSRGDSDPIDTTMRRIIYGVFAAVCLAGNIILLLVPMTGLEASKSAEGEKKQSQIQHLVAAFRLFLTMNMMLLSLVFIYTGLELSYWSGVFPTTISFTKRLNYGTHKLVALNAICQGCGQIIGGFCFGIMGDRFRRFGRTPIIAIGIVTHIMCYLLSFINFPADANMHETRESGFIEPSIALALMIGGLLGFGDACWNTQCYSILVDVYCKQSAQAFSIMKFFQAASACAAFFYAGSVPLPWNLLILLISGFFAACSFVYVEMASRKASTNADVPDNDAVQDEGADGKATAAQSNRGKEDATAEGNLKKEGATAESNPNKEAAVAEANPDKVAAATGSNADAKKATASSP